jgi:branched-chain amino acid aminotransferase
MSDALAWLNGRFLPRGEALLNIDDAGLVFAATVTDFCRTFRQQLFRWPDHLERLRRDCATCFIPLAVDDTELTAAAHDLVARNARLLEPRQELALVTFATPGPVAMYAADRNQDGPPTLCLHTIPLPLQRYRPFFEQGVSLAAIVHDPGFPSLMPASAKHRSRLHWWRAGHILRQRPTPPPDGTLPLLLADGQVLETAIGNLLLVLDGVVLTPPDGMVLAGVSLLVVEESCQQLGIPFARRSLTLEDCRAASEMLLCGSAFCLAGVRWLDGREVPWPGPLTRRLQTAWSERVGIDFAAQILSAR